MPLGWWESSFAPVVRDCSWEECDEGEGRLKAFASYIDSFDGDATEFEKALRLLECRRGVLLGTDVAPGRPPDNCPRVDNYECTNPTAARFRLMARHETDVVWPHLMKATVRSEVTQAALIRLIKTGNHRAIGTGENEWYTPSMYVRAARDVMGGIDVDPATSEEAQLNIRAASHYTIEDDGLAKPWFGRVWLNPPYSQPEIRHFVEKLVGELEDGRATEAILLTHNYTDTGWFHLAESPAAAICFTRGRIKFIDPRGQRAAPTQGQAFFYYGPNVERFAEVFGRFGFVR